MNRRQRLACLVLFTSALLASRIGGQTPVPQKQGSSQTKNGTPATDLYGDPLPSGAIARLGTVNLRAVGAKTALSPDGKTTIAVINGNYVKTWNAVTGKRRDEYQLPVAPPRTGLTQRLVLSPDGRRLALQEGNLPVEIWDIVTRQRVDQFGLPPNEERGAVFSPDGKMLAVPMTAVHLCRIGAGEQQILAGHKKAVTGVAFSSDGKLLASADGQTVICWNTANGDQIWSAASSAQKLVFTPDGKTLLAAPGFQRGNWQCWEAASGKPDTSRKLPEGVNCVGLALAPDNWTMAFSFYAGAKDIDPSVRVWDTRTGTLIVMLPTIDSIVAFFPDGKSLLTNGGTLQRWELPSGRPVFPDGNASGHRREVFRVVYSRDGKLLASSAKDGTIHLWDVASAKVLHVMQTSGEFRCTNLAFTSDAKKLLSADIDGNLYIWDTATGKELRRIPIPDEVANLDIKNVFTLQVTPDDKSAVMLCSHGLDRAGTISTWDLDTGKRASFVRIDRCDSYYSAFSPDGLTLASSDQLFDVATGKARLELEDAGGYFHSYVYSPDGRFIAGSRHYYYQEVNKFGGSRVWDAVTGKLVLRLDTEDVGQYAFTPDCCYLATCDMDGIQLWELATGKVVLKHEAHERRRGSFGASFASTMVIAPDGRSMATGHPDGSILLWGLAPQARTPLARKVTSQELPRLWAALADGDATKAFEASWQIIYSPELALPFLGARLRQAVAAPAEQTKALLADLDSQDFKKRQESTRQLHDLGERAATALHAALRANPSPEARRRLEALLDALKVPPTGETLAALRAIAVLERIGSHEARDLLKTLADGDAKSRLTQEAKLSLARLNR